MNTTRTRRPPSGNGSELPRTSLVAALAIALYVALGIGAPWLLFEAPALPEAVAATRNVAPRCASAPEFGYPCAIRPSVPARSRTLG
jgi:hypothetical protein